MVIFGKNKDNKAAKTHRYDLSSIADKEIKDVLLTEETNEAPLKASILEPDSSDKEAGEMIYQLVVESKNATGNEAPVTASLDEHIEKLCREYEAINKQLEKSLTTSNDLHKQLGKSKKLVMASYAALCIAVLAFLAGIGAVVVGINMQREVTDLKSSVASLSTQLNLAKKDTLLRAKDIDGRIFQLSDKVDKVFAVDNMDNVLQVTRDLRKQVQALANKNLASMNQHNQAVKSSNVSLPSLRLNSEKEAPPAHQQASKSEPDSKLDTTKKIQDDKLAPAIKRKKARILKKPSKSREVAKTTKNKPQAKPPMPSL